jgi:predicted metallopeptidase
MQYGHSDEARKIAERLIPQFHAHLNGVRIDYIFIDKAPKVEGKEVAGRARKVSGLNAFLACKYEQPEAEDFFVIEIAVPFWERYTAEQRIALVDHELCHCEIDEEGSLTMRGHDLEEFTEIVKRHGLWENDVETFAKVAALQLPLDYMKQDESQESAVAH